MVVGGACVVAGGCMVVGGVCVGYDEIRSMSGRYASYWNAFLLCFVMFFVTVGQSVNLETKSKQHECSGFSAATQHCSYHNVLEACELRACAHRNSASPIWMSQANVFSAFYLWCNSHQPIRRSKSREAIAIVDAQCE